MTPHDEFLELAAAAIDFGLEPSEQAALDAHLAACTPCRRRVIALRHDARMVRDIPPFVLAPERAQTIWQRIDQPRRVSGPTLRLIAVAALLALLAVSAVGVGAALLRDREDLSEAVTPPPIAEATPAASPPATIAPSASPSQQLPRPAGFAPDTIVEIVVPDLRVRTAPTVDNAISAKLEPLLGTGTRLEIIEGPVLADDYEWYLVQAIGWPHRGWVAAADHDGEPWIEDPASRGGGVPFSGVEESIAATLRGDVAGNCAPRTAGLPAGAVAGIECTLNTALVVRVGAYLFDSDEDATLAYLDRLSSSGVTLGSGECSAGRRGDRAWSSGAGLVSYAGAEWAHGRIGCFQDQYGAANVRATCGLTYVGILGRKDDLGALHAWAWQPVDQSGSGVPPGICQEPPAG